ncbi:MAG: PAS domain S-box protein, partial [Gallionella sp.]|nr:PAS domain S-box protein [Gallionella sp.]
MRIPDSFRDATLLSKLQLIVLFATAGGTLFALLLLFAQQWFLQRNELANNVRAQAAIVAINGSSALLFDDRRAAEQTMEALAAIDNIEYAVIIDNSGKYFADYARPGVPIAIHHHSVSEGGATVYTMNHLEVVVPIVLKQEQIGTIHVISNLAPVYNRLMWSLLVTVIAAMGAFLAVVMLLRRLLPVITDPLQDLVGLMNAVSLDKNYTLRAKLQGRDELGVLAQGFNDMLAQIQQRDEYLARHQEHLEEEVVKRTARLTEAQRIAHLGNWEWDIVSNMLDWSDEIYRIFGLTPQQFGATYDAFLHAVHPEDRQSVDEGVRDALEKNIPYSLDHRILLPDGSVRYVHEQAEVLRAEDGQPVKMRGTVQDITKDKLAEEKIRESEARYRGVFEYADDIIYLLAPDGTFNSLSPSFERLTGWQPQEWLGKSFAPIIHPDDLAYARTVFQNALDGQSTPLFELRIARKSGEYFDSELSLVPVSPGGKIAAIGIARDITERKQAEQEILRLNEMLETKVLERTKQLMAAQEELVRSEKLTVLGQVAGSVGHELRNPLGVMNNAVYFLQTVLSDADETTREYLNIIKDEIAASERI